MPLTEKKVFEIIEESERIREYQGITSQDMTPDEKLDYYQLIKFFDNGGATRDILTVVVGLMNYAAMKNKQSDFYIRFMNFAESEVKYLGK